jgi:hypothetical protein
MTNKDFNDYALMHIDLTKKSFNEDLSFDEESIFKLDKLIQTAWPDKPPVEMQNVIMLFGSFLGEAMRDIYGGQWVETEQGWGMKINEEVTILPFTKIKKRLINGEDDSISYFYETMKNGLQNNFSFIK